MRFKNARCEVEWKGIPKKLREICEEFEHISLGVMVEPVVTRIKEPVAGESGVHHTGRAVDFRDEYQVDADTTRRLYTDLDAHMIVEALNEKYPRVDGKAVAIHHSFGAGPLHFHIQIPKAWLEPGEG